MNRRIGDSASPDRKFLLPEDDIVLPLAIRHGRRQTAEYRPITNALPIARRRRMKIKSSPLPRIVRGVLGALALSLGGVHATAAEPDRPFRILLNSDGGSGALYAHEPPISDKQLCRVINSLAGTQVDVFIQCVSFGPFVSYDTKVGERYGVGRTEFEDPNFRRWAQNVNGLIAKGKDPLHIWSARAHELGMEFWPALRMNDIHKDWTERWPSLRCQWELDHPHVKIGSDSTDYYRRRWARKNQPSDGYTWAFDYKLQEVRDQKFALIDEICTNYDVDGFEMDFLSSPIYFKRGEVEKGMPLLTQFVRRVRKRLDELERRKGRRLTLLARVPPSFKMCELIGIDARTWIKEDLVDVIAPVTRGYLDMNADVRGFVAAAKGAKVRVIGGLSDVKVRHYTGIASAEMLRAAAAGYWHEGATGLHLFNFDCHCSGAGRGDRPLLSEGERRTLSEIGDPRKLVGKDKHYYITRDIEGDTPAEGGEMQLPLDLLAGQRRPLQLTVADDLDKARMNQSLRSVVLKVTWSGDRQAAREVKLQCNGEQLELPATDKQWTWTNPPIRHGRNVIALTRPAPSSGGRVRIEGVELLVNFQTLRARRNPADPPNDDSTSRSAAEPLDVGYARFCGCAREWNRFTTSQGHPRCPTVWRASDIDALFRKGLKEQGFLIRIGW